MLKRGRSYKAVADRIEELIQSKYEEGDRIPGERDLAKRFHASRPTVREAVVSLEIAGLVEVRMNSGIYVIGKANTRRNEEPGFAPFEILRARMIVEPEVAGMAAKHAMSGDFDKMQAGIQGMREEDEQNRPTEQGDRGFHLAVAGGCGNAMLAEVVHLLWDNQQKSSLWLRADAYARSGEFRQRWIQDHLTVLEAIRQRKADLAKASMQRHLENTWQSLLDAGQD
jgi:GntR family transcriptional regulator, uxu operon transcriptional repressor